MQRNAIAFAAALALATGAASAQSSVTVYGIVDAAVEYYSNSNAAGDNLTRMPSLGGGMFPSRIGFRGTEDLGGGLKAIFALENGFTPDGGALGQGGRLFGRQAWVGLSGSWGQLTVGRNYNMLFQSTLDVDLFGPSQYGLGSLDSAIPNGRVDNSIAYKGTFNGVTVGATYSLGRDTSSAGGAAGTNCAGESASSSKQCREYSGMARYDTPSWGVAAGYDRIHGGAGAAAGLTSPSLSDTRLHLGGYFKQAGWKIGGGMIKRDNEGSATARSNLVYLAAQYRVSPAFAVDGQVGQLDLRNSANDAKQVLVRGIYDLSRRTSVYIAAGHIDNGGVSAVSLTAGGTVGAGLGQTGIITGIKHAF